MPISVKWNLNLGKRAAYLLHSENIFNICARMEEGSIKLYCWQLKRARDNEDDTLDLHIAVDVEDLTTVLDFFDDPNMPEYALDCSPFPDKSPQHMDVGMENFMKNYKSDIVDYERLVIMITYEDDEILLWNNGFEEAYIKLTAKRLKELRRLFLLTKNSAYYYDNIIEATRITDDYDFKPCRIVVWGGHNGQVIYY